MFGESLRIVGKIICFWSLKRDVGGFVGAVEVEGVEGVCFWGGDGC